MPYAIELFFDDKTAKLISKSWQKLHEAKLRGYVPRSPARPHITLAVYHKVDEDLIPHLLIELAQKIKPFPIQFNGLGLFQSGVIYSAPTLSSDLITIQQQWLSIENKRFPMISEDHTHHHWTPHVTLIKQLRSNMWAKAIEILSHTVWPKISTVEAVSCVRFPPTTEISVIPLGQVSGPRLRGDAPKSLI